MHVYKMRPSPARSTGEGEHTVGARASNLFLTRVEKLHINGVALLGRGNDDEIISECRSLLPSTWPKL